MKHNELQEFYEILNYSKEDYEEEPLVINVINNIRYMWGNNKSLWFSHEELPLMNLIGCNYDGSIGLDMCMILHYDQIYRHPNKYIKDKDREYGYIFARKLALKMINHKDYMELKDWEKVFVLLSIRHDKSKKMKELVLNKTYKLLEEEPSNSIYLRFLKATIWDIHKCKENKEGYINEGYINEGIDRMNNVYNIEKENLLEIKNDEEINKILTKNIEEDKKKLGKNYISNIERKIEEGIYNIIDKVEGSKYAVSISGGVDSMILSYIMNKICKRNKKELILLHISYGNRECCDIEIKMLKKWSGVLGVSLYIRRIDEIKRSRSSSFRNVYEDITRRIRFSFYEYFNCPILLGHNKEDCYENMFSNLSKRIHYDNLVGVEGIKEENGICILRPLMCIMKSEIYDYANSKGIPYLYDSTPEWSCRGKMRDVLIPGINNFDKNILSGLYEYSNYTSFLEKQWKISFKLWIEKVGKVEGIFKISKDEFFKSNYINLNFWIQLWFSLDIPTRPSNKSFNNLIEHINRNKLGSNNKCILNKEYIITNNSDNIKIERQRHNFV